jgi:hypothetical protein
MTVYNSGFKQDVIGSWIEKDPSAQLVYSLDWATEWLPQGNTISQVTHAVTTTAGEATPLTIVSQGIQGAGVTYVELSGGTDGEIYTVTATVTTSDSDIDRRRFRIKVKNRFL